MGGGGMSLRIDGESVVWKAGEEDVVQEGVLIGFTIALMSALSGRAEVSGVGKGRGLK